MGKVGLERRVHQLRNSGQALLSCVEVEPIFSLFLICLRVCGEPQKTAGATHSKDPLKIIDVGEQPDYEQCILVSMKASLNEMLAPSALVIFSSLIIDGSAQLDYKKCISIPNKASLNEMLTPRALVQKSLGDLQFLDHRWQCTA